MKTNRIIGVTLALLILASLRTFAVVEQTLQVSGTNLVLSWPSVGNEYYMIQYWPNLQPGTSWIQLTNAYRANSTNRTTYTIPCCDLAAYAGTNSSLMAFSGGGESSGAMAAKTVSVSEDGTELWAMPADGFGSEVPLAIYPPGYDTSKLVITKKLVTERIKKTIASTFEKIENKSLSSAKTSGGESGGTMNLTSGGCNCPNMGFFRVFHVPNFPNSITNFIFDGPTFIPINFKDYRERVDHVRVLLNGNEMAYTVFMPFVQAGQTNWGMGIYFNRIPSGTYQIQLETTLSLNDFVGNHSEYLVLSNLPVSIVVNNAVTYTNWDDLVLSTNFAFRAATKTNNTDWTIDIYDAWGFYVSGASGHTTNGLVNWNWDLTDSNNNLRNSLDNDPIFYPEITFANNGQQTTRSSPVIMLPYPEFGEWVISYQDRFILEGSPAQQPFNDTYVGSMSFLAGGLTLWDIPTTLFPIKFGTNYTQVDRDASWSSLKQWIKDRRIRNLYYFGHGGSTRFGCDAHAYGPTGEITTGFDFPGTKAFISSQEVKDSLTKSYSTGIKLYRFVFLDGCQTALGNWPETFGVAKQTNDLNFYYSTNNPSNSRPSAFIGWSTDIGGEGWGNINSFWNFRTYWMSQWSTHKNDPVQGSLVTVLEQARVLSSWIPQTLFWNTIRVYGYTDLRLDEFNHKGQWP